MTSPVERITAVLLAHDQGATTSCKDCGAPADTRELQAAHVAQRVAAELQSDDDAVTEAIEGWFMDGNYASDKTFWEMGVGIREALAEEGFSVIQVREKP